MTHPLPAPAPPALMGADVESLLAMPLAELLSLLTVGDVVRMVALLESAAEKKPPRRIPPGRGASAAT